MERSPYREQGKSLGYGLNTTFARNGIRVGRIERRLSKSSIRTRRRDSSEAWARVGQRTYGSLKSLTPRSLKGAVGAAVEGVGAITSFLRMLPTFIIVGGQRCGTNSLYEYLAAHHLVGRALPLPEVHFFDVSFDRGMDWYRGHFPVRFRSVRLRDGAENRLITGESSPYYMFHPLAIRRVADSLPDIKLVVLLRNPVDRAYSHYNHERSRGHEPLSFEEAIELEHERLTGEEERIVADDGYRSFNHQHFSYLARGAYADQLERIFASCGRDRVLVLTSEDLFSAPRDTHLKALEFLGLPTLPLARYPKLNPGRYSGLSSALRRRLSDHFADDNQRLSLLLGRDFDWD